MSDKEKNHNDCMVEKIADFLIKVGEHCMKCEEENLWKEKDVKR